MGRIQCLWPLPPRLPKDSNFGATLQAKPQAADNRDNVVPIAVVVAAALLRLRILLPSKYYTQAADNRDNIVPIAVVVAAALLRLWLLLPSKYYTLS